MSFNKYKVGILLKAKYDIERPPSPYDETYAQTLYIQKDELFEVIDVEHISHHSVEDPYSQRFRGIDMQELPAGIKEVSTLVTLLRKNGQRIKIDLGTNFWTPYAIKEMTYYDLFEALPEGKLTEKIYT